MNLLYSISTKNMTNFAKNKILSFTVLSSFTFKLTFLLSFIFIKELYPSFFEDISYLYSKNEPRLGYGVAVTDINNDNNYEFIVAGYKYPNLILGFKNKKVINLNKNLLFADADRSTIGVVACDIDKDGEEEIYFLNTDTFSGKKKYGDRILKRKNDDYIDLFSLKKNLGAMNLTAGRSVACVDRKGNNDYNIYVSNYGGPARFYKVKNNAIIDEAKIYKLDKTTGGRAVVSGHILSNNMDIFAANERGANFLYQNENGLYNDVAQEYGVEDLYQNGRGTALIDFLYRGRLDIISANWQGYNRVFILRKFKFINLINPEFSEPSRVRTLIAADFDNDGYDEIFINNLGEPNKLFKLLDNGILTQIPLSIGARPYDFGTGAAVADFDNDGFLELLISNGESFAQPIKIIKAAARDNKSFIRIKPLNFYGAPARGATVTLITSNRKHSKTIDAGSGYLCQMEPIAHFGIRENEKIFKIIIKWTNGKENSYNVAHLNQTITVKQVKN